MAFTKVTHAGIGSTGTVLLQNLDVIGIVTAGFGVSTVDVFTTGITTFFNGTDSTSTTTGSVIVSGGVGIAGSLNVGGSVSVGGTLTYEDVTNIDSVGIITARSDILVGSGITLSPDGDGFFTGVITATSYSGIDLSDVTGATGDFSIADKIVHTGDTNTALRFPSADTITAETGGTERLRITSDGKYQFPGTGGGSGSRGLEIDTESVGAADEGVILNARASGTTGRIKLQTNSATALTVEGNGGNINVASNLKVAGVVTATSFEGSGANLSDIVSGITTEAASISGITTYLDLTKDDHELVVTGNNTISVIGGAQGTSHTLRLQNSGISTVTLDSTYFKFPSGASPAFPTADGSISLVSFTVHKAGAVGVNTVLLTGASVSFS